MEIGTLSERPPTLDSLFAQLEESMFRYKKEDVLTYLFDYSSRVLDIEGITLGEKGAEDFREFIMRNELSDLVTETMSASQEMKHPENCGIVLDVERAINNYYADPRKGYIWDIFKKSGFSRNG